MCGRFTLTVDPRDLLDAFPGISIPDEYHPRYNIAPTQPVAVITNSGDNKLQYFQWGLVPFWAKDPSIGNNLINARAETLSIKPAFKNAFRRRRCLILADGFFEWQSVTGQKTKQPFYFQLSDKQPFGFAGLWETWHDSNGNDLYTCTIITTQPNKVLEPIHNRMPVILKPEDYSLWLSTDEKPGPEMESLLKPYPDNLMKGYPVSLLVNSPANDSKENIRPIEQNNQ